MEKKVRPQKKRVFFSKSRAPWEVKKPAGFEAWFYTGGSVIFGHYPSRKKGGKRE